jgi:hypothetical protein
MSRLERLAAKSVTVTIDGVELEIKPLSVMDDLDLILKLEEPKDRGPALAEIMRRTLKEAVPEATDEEIKAVSLKHFKPIFEAIQKVNGLTEEEVE